MKRKFILLLSLVFILTTGIIFADDTYEEFDYNNPNISYIGSGWYVGSHLQTKTGMIKVSLVSNDEYRFNFSGTTLTIYTPEEYDYSSKLIIDGAKEYAPNSKNDYGIAYEINNLDNTEHSVRVINGNGSYNAISPTEIHLNTGEQLLPYNEGVNVPSKILIFESDQTEIELNQNTQLDMYMQNIEAIAAEDMLISFDPEYLSFEGINEVANMNLVYSKVDNGTVRVVVASNGEDNVINTKTLLSQLNFKGIKVGETTVSYSKAKVTDGITTEDDLTEEQIGDIIITIKEPQLIDVNKSGEYTLLDLGIEARHLGASLPNEDYVLDQHIDNVVDTLDLIDVYSKVLANPNYSL